MTEAHRRPTGVGVGMLGMGVVGSGVAQVLSEKSGRIADATGCPVTLRSVLIRDLSKPRSFEAAPGLLTTDPRDVIDDPLVDIVVEVMGGESPALDYIRQSISAGKHVVTANKEVIARHGPDVLALARKKGVQVLFEASVGGGTPIVAPLLRDLVANEVTAIIGIINGTTNYILTRMAYAGVDFEEALKEAQELGFAESDPTNDVEGIDAAYKLAILSTLAFRARVKDTDVHREGITRLTARDFRYASELGFAIKLMAMARKSNGALQLRVHPVFVPSNQLIAKVDGVLNAVEVETDLAGRVLFHGRGAGAMPTTSAVVADVIEISRDIVNNAMPAVQFSPDSDIAISPIDDLETKYYLRMSVEDRSGVLAQIAKVLGDLDISIDSVLQKGTDEIERRAELVLTTHRAREASMQEALRLLGGLEVVHEVGNMVRVEEWED